MTKASCGVFTWYVMWDEVAWRGMTRGMVWHGVAWSVAWLRYQVRTSVLQQNTATLSHADDFSCSMKSLCTFDTASSPIILSCYNGTPVLCI